MENLHKEVHGVVDAMKDELIGINHFIFAHPELGDEEFESVAYLTGVLKDAGFEVTCPYKGIETAFRADLKTGEGPTVGFLAEYDALPGYGPDKVPGHACGHNWIAATTVGAGLALAKLRDKFSGTVVVFGTPAEESFGRKVDLANAGAFDDVDAAFQFHLGENTNLTAEALAMNAAEFVFKGHAAHAAASPELGVNALDALLLTFTGINYLRQQLPSDVRIHGIVTSGGEAANTIPDLAKGLFYVRAARRSTFLDAFEKVQNCARGAATMTGATLEINYPENQFDDLLNNSVLRDMMIPHMEASGFVISEEAEGAGSTDVGNVSYACPTLYSTIEAGTDVGVVHEEAYLKVVDSPEAHKLLLQSVESFVCMAIELSQNPDKVKAARKAFEADIAK